MTHTFNKYSRVAVLLLIASGLSACSNLLYSNNSAPVYSSTSAKRGGAPSVLNSSVTPVPGANAGSMQPAQPTPSIEKPGGMRVNNSQNDPYAKPVRPSVASMPAPTTATQTTAVPTVPGQAAIAQTAPPPALPTVANNTASATNASSGAAANAVANDPRIKEGSNVLQSQQTGTAVNTARPASAATATRPSAVINKAPTQPATAPTANRTQSPATVQKNEAPAVKKPAVTANNADNTTKKPSASQAAAATSAKPVAAAKTPTATTALLQEARGAVASGNYDKAASALERAHRIEPGNAKILYDIAQIRYAQGKYRQAESFASKAANYSGSKSLSKKIWTLLSNSRRALGNSSGAESAAKKAATF